MHPAIRPAAPADVPDILRLIRELAEHVRHPDAAVATQGDVRAALFPADGPPSAYCHVAEADGRAVGIAVWFPTWSTWSGRQGIWLEDLYVEEAQRGSGLGRALLASLAEVCVERGWHAVDWTVLTWNTPSVDFYRSLGAISRTGSLMQRLTGDALTSLAAGAEAPRT